MILNTCFEATAGTASKVEVLASSGVAEVSTGPGIRSFITRLIAAMKDFTGPFNISMLYGRLCSREFRIIGGQTPIHIQRSDTAKPSIFLAPIFDGPPPIALVQPIPPKLRHTSEPKVLIKFSLSAEAGLPDIQEWINYLSHGLPSFVEREMVTVEGLFRSGSTTVLLTLPISVWGCLPQDPALSFVAFVDSSSMLLQLPRSRRTKGKDIG